MKNLGLLLVLLVCSPVWASISLANSSTSASLTCNPTCGAFSLGFTAASGDVLAVWGYSGNNGHLSAATGGTGVWVFPANCTVFQSSNTGVATCAYIFLTGTATTVTMTFSASVGTAFLHARAYHSTNSGTWGVEAVPTAVTSTSCGASGTKCVAPTVTITGANDVVISSFAGGNTACATVAPFGNFAAPNGDGIADNLNVASGTGASFTQGTACPTAVNSQGGLISIAFIEPTSGGAVVRHRAWVIQSQ